MGVFVCEKRAVAAFPPRGVELDVGKTEAGTEPNIPLASPSLPLLTDLGCVIGTDDVIAALGCVSKGPKEGRVTTTVLGDPGPSIPPNGRGWFIGDGEAGGKREEEENGIVVTGVLTV